MIKPLNNILNSSMGEYYKYILFIVFTIDIGIFYYLK